MSASLCLADAQVLIDGVRYGFLQSLLATYTVGVASSAYLEVKFYYDDAGAVHPIDLASDIQVGRLSMCSATGADLLVLFQHGVSRRLGAGELESLALVMTQGFDFCTADRLVVKTLRDLGLYDRWVPLEDMLGSMAPPVPVPEPKYLRATIDPNGKGGSSNRAMEAE